MEAMFKISVPDGNNVFWDDVRVFLQEIVSDYNDEIEFSVSEPILPIGEQNKVFDHICSLLDYMSVSDYCILFDRVYSKVYCSLIPVSPARLDEAAIGVASCREDDDFSYEYGCILAFARALKDEYLESQIWMCDPQAAEEYFESVDFDRVI